MNEQEHCKSLLQMRVTGCSIFGHYRKLIKSYIPLIILLSLVIYLIFSEAVPMYTTGTFLAMLFGLFLRDYQWVNAYKKTWPLNERILNWQIVADIAGPHQDMSPAEVPDSVVVTSRTSRFFRTLWSVYVAVAVMWLTLGIATSFFLNNTSTHEAKGTVLHVDSYVWNDIETRFALVQTADNKGQILVDLYSDAVQEGDQVEVKITIYSSGDMMSAYLKQPEDEDRDAKE